ncbi:MAG TPA: hypothetical protein VKU61_11625 [Candidatus Binatia bacterium]|nr:hypothetical protein [Candidatus Binatia bacterium]
MASESNRSIERDGVTISYTGAARAVGVVLACALVLLGLAAWLILRSSTRRPAADASAPPTPTAPAPSAPKKLAEAPVAKPTQVEKPPTVAAPSAPPAEEEQTYTLLKPGEHAGLDVFPPPGTKPIKRGIVVPDDFELPPGYVRHYQTTDDGRRLPPILMFHPDYAGVDANGNPVVVPEDRIVPPEMAPPGLPVEMLDPDHPASPPAEGRAR